MPTDHQTSSEIFSDDAIFMREMQAKEELFGELTAKIAALRDEEVALKSGNAEIFAAERMALKSEIMQLATENAKLKLDAGDLNKRVAMEVAKLGIRKDSLLIGTGRGGELSATEKVLQAKGVSSIAELEAKRGKS